MYTNEKISHFLKKLEEKLFNDYTVVVEYVENNSDNFYYYDEGIIEIGASQPKMVQLFSLIHEVGHVILHETEFFTPRKYNLKRYRKDYRVNVVREEIMAWDVGRNYACNLGIDIDKKNWEKYRVDSLLRYISWAYNPSEYKSHD